MSATLSAIQLPHDLTTAQLAEIRAALPPGVTTYQVQPLAPGQVAVTEVPHAQVLGWTQVLNSGINAAAHLVLPGPIGALLGSALQAGAEALEGLLLGTPVTEHLTIAQIQSKIASLPVAEG